MRLSHAVLGSVMVFFPLWKRGIEEDCFPLAKTKVAESPLPPLFQRGEKIYRAFGA